MVRYTCIWHTLTGDLRVGRGITKIDETGISPNTKAIQIYLAL